MSVSTGIRTAPVKGHSLRLGHPLTDGGGLSFWNGTHHTQLVAPSSTGTTGGQLYALPESQGTTGQFLQLQSTGGQLGWGTGSTGGGSTGGSTGNFENDLVFTTGIEYPEIKAERGYLRIKPADTGGNARLRFVPVSSPTHSQKILLFDQTASTGVSYIEVRRPGDTGDNVVLSINANSGDLLTTGSVDIGANNAYKIDGVEVVATSGALVFGEDFLGDALNAQWATVTGGAPSGSVALQNSLNGVVRCTASTGALGNARITLGTDGSYEPFAASKNTDMTAVLRSQTRIANTRSGVGLTNFSSLFTTTGHAAYFKASTGNSGQWECISADGAASESTNTTDGTTGWVALRIVLSTGSVKFYINGTLKATHTTRVPSGQMYFEAGELNLVGAPASALWTECDWVRIKQDR